MLTITIHDPALEQWLADRARVERTGIDEIATTLMATAVGLPRSPSGAKTAGTPKSIANQTLKMESISPSQVDSDSEPFADGKRESSSSTSSMSPTADAGKPGDAKKVDIFTDGACTGNPGKGGYGVLLKYGDRTRELSGGYRRTTNNRMELMAAITGLQSLKYRCKVTLYTDSQYVANGITKGWARKWRANGWRRSTGEPAINPDLWSLLLDLCDRHDVNIVWIRGHAGHVENERCDRLSVAAAAGPNLQADSAYENQSR